MIPWLEGIFAAWTLLVMALGTAYFYLYLQHILPTLDKQGESAVWSLSRKGHEKQIEAYGRICREQRLPMGRYRFASVFHRGQIWLVVVALLIWVALVFTSRCGAKP
ncbi:MAG: hypothetical protein ACRDL7_04920 [Gaiellaceae bacterium]